MSSEAAELITEAGRALLAYEMGGPGEGYEQAMDNRFGHNWEMERVILAIEAQAHAAGVEAGYMEGYKKGLRRGAQLLAAGVKARAAAEAAR